MNTLLSFVAGVALLAASLAWGVRADQDGSIVISSAPHAVGTILARS